MGTFGSIKRAAISASASGDNTIVAAVSGKKILVTHYVMVPANAVTVTWKSGSGTSISGAMSLSSDGGGEAVNTEEGVISTAAGEALVLNLDNNIAVGGHLNYRVV